MTNLDIKINIRELTDYSADLDSTEDKKTLLLMIKSFSEYISRLYIRSVREEINSRRYRGKWEPLDDEDYIEYIGGIPTISIADAIEESLESVKIGHYFIVRISPKYEYPGTDSKLLKVVRAIEEGTSKFNARPLLSKNVIWIRRNIFDLWRGYLTKRRVI